MIQTRSRAVFFLAGLLVLRASAAADTTIARTVSFDPRALRFHRTDGYDRVTLGDCVSTFRPGEPQVPLATLLLVLPPGAEVQRVDVVETRSMPLPYDLDLRPAQPPEILSAMRLGRRPRGFVGPEPSIYRSPAAYPAEIVRHLETRSCGGLTVAAFAVRPLQYFPAERRCVFHEEVSFAISCRRGGALGRVPARRPAPALARTLRRLASNPEDLEAGTSAGRLDAEAGETRVEYLIVTDESFAAAFQPLADWKTKKGVPSRIVTTSWIYAHQAGPDPPAKIREFLKYAVETWDTQWVLLGGDTAVVPYRAAYALDSLAGFEADEDQIPCDLYYSDLDGTWNSGGDPAVFGEVADDVDLYPDVFVGRAPSNTVADVQTFVAKVLAYEKDPPPEYLGRMVFAAEILWDEPYTDQGVSKDRIDQELIPDRFDIAKLYARDGNESREAVLAALNRGAHIFNHDGHAWYTVMQVGNGSLAIPDVEALANGRQQTILYSIGCWEAAFDRDAIAEHFVNNPNGGGVANIGNSRYGWGAMGEPGFGYSDRFDREFYRVVFEDGERRIGAAMALSKATFVPLSREANVYRWCQYQINLLGDPEMAIWTESPRRLVVEHPATVPVGNLSFPVTVTHGGAPVAGALVCAMTQGDVYAVGRTGPSGRIALSIAPKSPAEPLVVTVTAANFLPSETTAQVAAGGAYIAEAGLTVEDGEGDGDGLLAPGETVRLAILLRNCGDASATGVTAFLESASAGISVTAGIAAYGDIAPGATAASEERFTVVADSGLTGGETVYLRLTAADASSETWESLLAVRVASPLIACRSAHADDAMAGNGNGVVEPGERVDLVLDIENVGLAAAHAVKCAAASGDPYLLPDPDPADFGSLAPGERRAAFVPVTIAAACPVPRFIAASVDVFVAGEYASSIPVELVVGATGFFDDGEHGTASWSAPGAGNLWHVSSRRSRSGSRSWYCGVEGLGTYVKANESVLFTPVFDLPVRPVLSFWAWYDVALYGTTGLYVEVSSGGGAWEKLDFLGSGGALPGLLMGNAWMEYRYDLSRCAPAAPFQVRFRFASDGEPVCEGVYVDDVAVRSAVEAFVVGFVRGDANADGSLNIADVLYLLGYLLVAGPDIPCRDAADANDDGELDISDAIRVLLHLFAGRSFGPPLGICAEDATPDGLDCRSARACGDKAPR
ncbi:MAG: C25 family cysteine peptidase [Planctomycetota bacterium]